jgi:hypothetical protein
MWGSLKDKLYKRNAHTLEELRSNISSEIVTVSKMNTGELTITCSTGILSAFVQEGKNFSI